MVGTIAMSVKLLTTCSALLQALAFSQASAAAFILGAVIRKPRARSSSAMEHALCQFKPRWHAAMAPPYAMGLGALT